jgi:hypothetical protein
VNDQQNRATWGRLNQEQHAATTGAHTHAVTHSHSNDNSHISAAGWQRGQQQWEKSGEAAWGSHNGVQRGPSGEAVGHREVSRWSRPPEDQAMALAAEDEGSHIAVSGGHAHGHRHAGGHAHGHYHWHYRDGDQPGDHHAHEHDADDLGAEVAETEGMQMSYGYGDDYGYACGDDPGYGWRADPDPEMAEREFGLTARERDQSRMRTLFADPDFSIRDAIAEFAKARGMSVDAALELCAEAAGVGEEYSGEAAEDWQLADGLYRIMGNDPAALDDGDPEEVMATADAEAHAVMMLAAGPGDYHPSPFATGPRYRADDDIPDAAVQRLLNVHQEVNGPKVVNHVPTGRKVHHNHLRGRDVTSGGTDSDQPSKGGRPFPGVKDGIYRGMAGFQGTMGGPEAILKAHEYEVRGRR